MNTYELASLLSKHSTINSSWVGRNSKLIPLKSEDYHHNDGHRHSRNYAVKKGAKILFIANILAFRSSGKYWRFSLESLQFNSELDESELKYAVEKFSKLYDRLIFKSEEYDNHGYNEYWSGYYDEIYDASFRVF